MHSLVFPGVVASAYLAFVAAQFTTQFAGPFDVEMREIRRCANPGSDTAYFDKTRLTKVNRSLFLYSTNYSWPYGFTDDIILMVSYYVKGNGGWRLIIKDKRVGPVCTVMKKFTPILVRDIAKVLGFWPRLCPYPPGVYELKNVPMILGFSAPALPYNSYLMEFWYSHSEERFGCGILLCDIVPKKKHRKHKAKSIT